MLDPFCGSGTILIAAERTGRKARALEIDPAYVDVAVRRWQAYTGKSAVLAGSGETFETIEEQQPPSQPPPDHGEQIWWKTLTITAPILRLFRLLTSDEDYRAGPGRPPKEHQFKKGQSGNPKGAKRKPQSVAPDLKLALERALNQTVTLKQGEKERTVTLAVPASSNLLPSLPRVTVMPGAS